MSPKRARPTEAALALLLQARSLLANSGEAEASAHLDECIAWLEPKLPLRAPPAPAAAFDSAALPPSPQRSQQTQTQSSLSLQATAGTQADGPLSADASSQVVPASAHAASQAVAMQSVATTQAGGTQTAAFGQRNLQENRVSR